MLPEILSNGACSLRPNEEKLTFSAVFEMNNKAKIIKNGLVEQLLILIKDLLMKKHKLL